MKVIHYILCINILITFSAQATQLEFLKDLSKSSDEELVKTIKSGVAGVTVGLITNELIAPRIPHFSGYSHSKVEIISPQVVKGAGTLMCIEGARAFISGSTEWYRRLWNKGSLLQKGLYDCGMAVTLYAANSYVFNSSMISTPYLEMGGEAVVVVTFSYLGLRGIRYINSGLQELVSETNVTDSLRVAYNKLSIPEVLRKKQN